MIDRVSFLYGKAREAAAVVVEDAVTDVRNTFGNCQARKAAAVIKCACTNACDTLRNRNARKAGAAVKSMVSDTGHAVFNNDRQNFFAVDVPRSSDGEVLHRACTGNGEHTVFGESPCYAALAANIIRVTACAGGNGRIMYGSVQERLIGGSNNNLFPVRFRSGVIHIRQTGAVIEGVFADARHTRRDRDAIETVAVHKGIVSNARHAFWDHDARKAGTALESSASNARHAFWNRNACEIAAVVKCTVSDARYAL